MDSFLEHMRATTGLDDDVLITMFYFQLNGCLAVIKRNIRHHDGKWNDIQCTIDSFLKNGFDSLSK